MDPATAYVYQLASLPRLGSVHRQAGGFKRTYGAVISWILGLLSCRLTKVEESMYDTIQWGKEMNAKF